MPIGDEVDERTPLAEEACAKNDGIPWVQLAILCYARISEGWLFFTIMPYIAQMVEEAGVKHEEIGFYAGLIESAYSVTELLTMQFVWSTAGDRYGRKPVLIFTMAGIALSVIAFGFSKTVWQMIVLRAACGCFSGSIATIRVMFSEVSTPETRGTVFSYFSLTGSLSALLSPLAGGLLAKPADRFNFFRDWSLFVTYPYLLPSLLAGSLPATTVILAAAFLNETRPAWEDHTCKAPSTRELLRAPKLSSVLVMHNWLNYIGFAWMAIAPVFWYTRIDLGGLQLSSLEIAWLMSITGVSGAILAICINPLLHRNYGTIGVLWLGTVSFGATFVFQPIIHLVRQYLGRVALMGALTLNVGLVYGQSLAYYGLSIAVVEVSPSPQALGSVVSLFLINAILMRSFSPATATSIYAFGVDKHIAGGQLAWIALTCLTGGLCWYMSRIGDISISSQTSNMQDSVNDST